MGRRIPRLRSARVAFALCGTLASCTASVPDAPLVSARPLHLYEHLHAVQVEGAARSLLGSLPYQPWLPALSVDFDDGSLASFTPFSGFGETSANPTDFARVAPGVCGLPSGMAAELRGGVPHGVSLRTAPIPVDPASVYRLRYAIAVEGVSGGPRTVHGRASLYLYRLNPEEATEPGEWLSDPGLEQTSRVLPVAELRVPPHSGTRPWWVEETTFTTGPEATHMILSLDLSRPEDDRAEHWAQGKACFDDVALWKRSEPLPLRYRELVEGAGRPHPLKVAVKLGHPASDGANELRQAIAAPAPSALSFATVVPQRGMLSLGLGLLPDAEVPRGPAVTFSVEILDAGRRRHVVLWHEVEPDPGGCWRDVDVDLAAFAGQRVTIILRTEGPSQVADADQALSRLPEAGAVWSYPVLHDRDRRGRTVVLVGLDAVAAAHTSSYGYPRETTPSLSRIAGEGLLFGRALSASPWTLPAFATMLTGLPPGMHRAGELLPNPRPAQWLNPLAPGILTVAERLRLAGWETRAWINNPLIARSLGLHQGFTAYVDYATQGRDEAAAPGVDSLLAYLDRPRGHDAFVFLHLMDPHTPYVSNDAFRKRFVEQAYSGPFTTPYDPLSFKVLVEGRLPTTPADRRRLADLHDAAVAYADNQLGRVWSALRRRTADSQVALLVTADHGEEFWEHGSFEHGHSMYDELLRVPLVVFAPERVRAPRVVDSAVSTQDIAATLLDLAGLDVPASLDSQSLLRFADGGSLPSRLLTAQNTLFGVERLAAERDGVKYVYNQQRNGQVTRRAPRPAARHELYFLAQDPGEQRNLFSSGLARALPLHQALAARFVDSLRGCYVLDLESGGGRHLLEGALDLPPGSSWHRFVRDYVWPLENGRPGTLRITYRPDRIRFRLGASRAILGFLPREGTGPVTLRLMLDGEPAPRKAVALGEGGSAPDTLPAVLTDDRLLLSTERLLRSGRGGVRVVFGKLPDTGRPPAPDRLDIDPALRGRLEALGYLEQPTGGTTASFVGDALGRRPAPSPSATPKR